jgi:hypothetical protein
MNSVKNRLLRIQVLTTRGRPLLRAGSVALQTCFAFVVVLVAFGRVVSAAPAFESTAVIGGFEIKVPSGPEVTLFVDATAGSDGDGSSWRQAFYRLESALSEARENPDVKEIWIAQGSYAPRDGRYRLIDGVALIGGFAGYEDEAADADPYRYPTILTRGVDATGLRNVRLAGLTFRSIHGVALDISDAEVEISDCVFEENTGGALFVESGSEVSVHQSLFARNSDAETDLTSTVHSSDSVLNISTSRFIGNFSSAGAVGVYRGSFQLTDSEFRANRSWSSLILFSYADARVERCSFVENWIDSFASLDGAAIIRSDSSSVSGMTLELANSVIAENSATALHQSDYGSRLLMTNTTIFGNHSASEGAGILLTGGTRAVVANSVIAGNCLDTWAGAFPVCAISEQSNLLIDGWGDPSLVTIHTSAIPSWTGAAVATIWDLVLEPPKLSLLGSRRYTPLAGSPLIDAGDGRAHLVGKRDVYGRIRSHGPVDIGAVERH